MKALILVGILASLTQTSVANAQITMDWTSLGFSKTDEWADPDGASYQQFSIDAQVEVSLLIEPAPATVDGSALSAALRTVDSHPQEVLDLVAAATGDLFQGNNVTAVEQLFTRVGRPIDEKAVWNQVLTVQNNTVDLKFVVSLVSSDSDTCKDDPDTCEPATVDVVVRDGKDDDAVVVYLWDENNTAIGFDGLTLDWVIQGSSATALGFDFANPQKTGYFGSW